MTSSLTLSIASKRLIAETIVLLDLQHPDASELPAFMAGAHLLIDLPGGLSRAYSLCNDPDERRRYQIAVNLAPDSRGGSRAVHELLQMGQRLSVSLPRNHFPLEESAQHSVLLAGGIGITPLLAMARRLQALGRSWEMHYSTRSPARCAFKTELETGPLAPRTRLYFDAGPGTPMDVKTLLTRASADSYLYVCGPAGLIDHALALGREAGWPSAHLHSERFGLEQAPQSGTRAFRLVLARSGLTLEVPPDQTVVHVLREAGIDVPTSCEQGVCGTCITDVLAGRPDHRDQCLDEGLRTTCFTPCCSRAMDDTLTIDL